MKYPDWDRKESDGGTKLKTDRGPSTHWTDWTPTRSSLAGPSGHMAVAGAAAWGETANGLDFACVVWSGLELARISAQC